MMSLPTPSTGEACHTEQQISSPASELPPRDDAEAFEKLNKWKRCERDVGEFMVYQQHLQRAEYNGFPSSLEVGRGMGLTAHQVAALMGWTTGDFRFVNPVARGEAEATFEDYPSGVKALCRLAREEVMPYVHVLASALQALPPVPPGQRLWRGHRMRMSNEAGSVIALSGFTSATYDRDEALRFATQVTDSERSAQRTLIAIEEHSSGRSIAKFSARRGELEVLFPLNRRFQVLPGERADADERAVQDRVAEMRRSIPEAEVQLIRVREVDEETMLSE